MALSDYDCLAFDSEGMPCRGKFADKNGDFVWIYKNWVYVGSEKIYKKDRGFVNPVIAEIQEGQIDICSFKIKIKRGPQRGAFVFVSSWDTKDGYKYFGGIGCSGYITPAEVVLKARGREKDIERRGAHGSRTNPTMDGHEYFIELDNPRETIVYWDDKINGKYPDDKYCKWVGVAKSTRDEWFKWIESMIDYDFDDELIKWLKKCKKHRGIRYNQGDEYFSDRLNFKLPATKVGKAAKPIISAMIGG